MGMHSWTATIDPSSAKPHLHKIDANELAGGEDYSREQTEQKAPVLHLAEHNEGLRVWQQKPGRGETRPALTQHFLCLRLAQV